MTGTFVILENCSLGGAGSLLAPSDVITESLAVSSALKVNDSDNGASSLKTLVFKSWSLVLMQSHGPSPQMNHLKKMLSEVDLRLLPLPIYFCI